MYKRFLSVALLAAVCGASQAATNGPMMTLAIEALEGKTGEATKQFPQSTTWVVAMRKQFKTSGPVTVTSKVVQRYNQAGCGRIQTFFRIHAAKVVSGKFEDVLFSVNYNTCTDGQPPTETLDIQDVAKWSKPQENFTERTDRLPPQVPIDQPNAKPAKSGGQK